MSGTLISNSSEAELNTYIIKPRARYFNFFDSLVVLKTEKEGVFVFLSKKKEHYLSSPNYKEWGMITQQNA